MNKYLNVSYLKSLDAQAPFYFGLGFIQLKLNNDERIHFWHPKFKAMEPEEVHNHRYNFTSKIISGQMIHETWDWTPINSGPWNPVQETDFELVQVSCSAGSEEKPVVLEYGQTKMTGRYTMNAGDEYWFEGNQFHRTDTDGAITFLKREAIQTDKAMIIRQVGASDYCPFSVKISTDECWKLIQETIDQTQ